MDDTGSISSIDEAQEAGSFLLSPDDAISVSSVDFGIHGKATKGASKHHRRSLSRLGLNLMSSYGGGTSNNDGSKDESLISSSVPKSPMRNITPPKNAPKSPSLIPRFLRNSFSRLINPSSKKDNDANAKSGNNNDDKENNRNLRPSDNVDNAGDKTPEVKVPQSLADFQR